MHAVSSLPSVSIIITAYNAERFIRTTVSAALNQDYPNYEVIVLDDGSEDRTETICKSLTDPRLRYIKSPHIGRSQALNTGVHLATGDYIAINDADDLSLPNRLTCTIPILLRHPEAAMVATAYTTTSVFQEDLPSVLVSGGKEPTVVQWLDPIRLYRGNSLVHSTVVFPKSVWRSAGGYDDQLEMCVDYDFFLRIMQFGKIALIPESTVLFFKNPATFFKRKSHREYLTALFTIKRRAHRLLALPTWTRVCDLIPFYLIGRTMLNQLFTGTGSLRRDPRVNQ